MGISPILERAPEKAELEAEERQRLRVLADSGLIEDAEDDAGLVFPLPSDATIIRIIRGYDTRRTTKKKVRCAACKQHQPHHKGFRVEIEDGAEARIGFNCGEAHFGEGAWQAAISDYDRRVEHAQYRARIRPALDAIGEIMPLIREWHDRTKQFARWVSRFRQEVPQLFGRLAAEARQREGRLEQQRRRKQKRVNRQGHEEQHMTVETVVVSRIPFPGMFLGATPNHGLNGATTELGCAVALLEHKTDAVSLARAFAHLRQARQHVNDAARVHQGVLLNLNPEWLSALCTWANQENSLEATYEADGAAIMHDEGGVEGRFELLTRDTFGAPTIDRINSILR